MNWNKLDSVEEERAIELHEKSIYINTCAPFVVPLGGFSLRFQKYYDLCRKGGVTAVCPTYTENPLKRTVDTMASIYGIGQDRLMVIENSSDIIKSKAENKIGIIFGTQNTEFFGRDINLLYGFKKLGLRIVGLAYNKANLVGVGCGGNDAPFGVGIGETYDAGLTMFGRKVIEKLNELNILISLSHVGYKTSMDAIELSNDPVAITHSNCRALRDIYRNKSDEEIYALAEKQGVMGMTVSSKFLVDQGGVNGSTLQDLVAHINHVVDLVGVDHIGIGTDISEFETQEYFDEVKLGSYFKTYPEQMVDGADLRMYYPEGIRSISDSCNITRALVASGFSDQEITKILGLNWLRLFEKVWKK